MKRPQGYDRQAGSVPPRTPAAEPPAAERPAPERPASKRPVRKRPVRETPAPKRSAREKSARERPGSEPRASAADQEGTAPTVDPLMGAVSIAEVSSRTAETAPYDRLPSNRDIGKALRAARKERKRVERGEVRRFTKRSRRRRRAWAAAGGVLGALVLGVALLAFSPILALKNIEVIGASRLDPKAIEAKLGDQLGTPLPLLDQAGISHDLAAFPLIRSYTIESHLPDTIVIRVVEREPIGAVQEGAAFVLVDAARVPISSTAARPDGVPLITASGGSAEKNVDSPFAAVASVLSALPADTLAQVDAISATTKDDVSFTLRSTGATVVWGSAEESKLKAADLAALLAGAGGASHYDVSSPHSVTTG